MAAQDLNLSRDSRPQTLFDLLIPEELKALITALQTVINGPGYGSITLDIRAGRVNLITVVTSIKPAATGKSEMENVV